MSKSKKKNKQTKKIPKSAAKTSAKGPAFMQNASLHGIIIFVLSMLLYANTFTHDFAQDDAIVIHDNMFTSQGLEGIPGILGNDTFFGFFKEEGKAQLVSGGRYRPLTLILFAFEVELFGMNPVVGHVMNAVFYGLTGLFLYWLLLQFFAPQGKELKGFFIAFFASLLFVSHPIHTEAVANIKGRDEIICLLGSLIALYLSFLALRQKNPLLHIATAVIFFLALLAKENAITFLAVVPLSLYFFSKAKGEQFFLHLLPFLVASVAFLFLRSQIIPMSFGDASMELMNNPFLKIEGGRYVLLSKMEQLAIIVFTMGKYLQLLFFPIILTHDYYPRQIDLMQWTDPLVILSLLLYIGLFVYAVLRLLKKDPISFCILYFFATVSIISNVFFSVGTNMSERFMFMPSLGFCLAIAILIWRMVEKKPAKNLSLGLALAVLLTALFSIRTVMRNPAWQSNYTLFTTDIQSSPNSAKLRNAVGGELITQSVKDTTLSEQVRAEMRKEAVGHLLEATKIHPNYKNSYLLLGNAYNYLKDFDKSIANYQQALRIDESYAEANNNLIITYRDAGRYYGEQAGDLDKALKYLELAYAANQQDYETLRLLGVAYGIKGDTQRAVDLFTRALQLQPNEPGALLNLSTAYYRLGNEEQAKLYQQKALEIDPNALNNRN